MCGVSTDQTERVGVHAVSFILADLGWFPKELARPDYGVDLWVETATEDGRPSGRHLAVQIKSGSSYVSAGGGGTLYVDHAHVQYWNGYSIPVIVVVYNADTAVAYWQVVAPETVKQTRRRWEAHRPLRPDPRCRSGR